ncbi:MAG: CpaF family protein [Myxococcales bacterium]|nr:MAG: CpaF family protein [Myxococcales bacterium]
MNSNSSSAHRIFEQALADHLQPIAVYLKDETVSEILINGAGKVYVERAGKLMQVQASFATERALIAALRTIAQYVGRQVDENNPILEARLPDGSRVQAVLPPISTEGPTVAIRRFQKESMDPKKLLLQGTLGSRSMQFLQAAVGLKQNILVAGGTGSGKTSLLNALSSFFYDDERIVVLEDSRELQIPHEHVVYFEARPPSATGKGEISIRELFRASLRMRPDRIVVGEVRGKEALDLVQAMTSGHGGCLATLHATHVKDTLTRLETLSLMSDIDLPLLALRLQIASAVDLVVQVERMRDGTRLVTEIAELQGYREKEGYHLVPIFERVYAKDVKQNAKRSRLVPTGVRPTFEKLAKREGIALPDFKPVG